MTYTVPLLRFEQHKNLGKFCLYVKHLDSSAGRGGLATGRIILCNFASTSYSIPPREFLDAEEIREIIKGTKPLPDSHGTSWEFSTFIEHNEKWEKHETQHSEKALTILKHDNIVMFKAITLPYSQNDPEVHYTLTTPRDSKEEMGFITHAQEKTVEVVFKRIPLMPLKSAQKIK